MKTIERKRRFKIKSLDYMWSLYETLSKVTGLSPRLIKGVHERHTERSWFGHWIDGLYKDFVFVSEDEKQENINSLLDYLGRMRSVSDIDFFNEIRVSAQKRLGRPRRRLVARTRC